MTIAKTTIGCNTDPHHMGNGNVQENTPDGLPPLSTMPATAQQALALAAVRPAQTQTRVAMTTTSSTCRARHQYGIALDFPRAYTHNGIVRCGIVRSCLVYSTYLFLF